MKVKKHSVTAQCLSFTKTAKFTNTSAEVQIQFAYHVTNVFSFLFVRSTLTRPSFWRKTSHFRHC